MRVFGAGLVLCFALVGAIAHAQNVARAVAERDGIVQVVFPTRPDVCGDGETFIRAFNRGNVYIGDNAMIGGGWNTRPCSGGQGRVLATVVSGEVTRARVFVGPIPQTSVETRTIRASGTDAAAWLGSLAERATERVAGMAIQALMFVDAPASWPLALRVARADDRGRSVRQAALNWLARGVIEKLDLADVDEHESDAAEVRAQAVFAVSQQRKTESVPELIDLVKTAKNPVVRKSAIFWLGQVGDARAADVFADLLAVR